MIRPTRFRAFVGFAVAWVSSVCVAFIGGCFIALVMDREHIGEFLKAIVSFNTEAWSIFGVIGSVSAAIAAMLSAAATVFIGWPLYLLSIKHERISRNTYLLAGIVIALIISGVLVLLQQRSSPLSSFEYRFEFLTIILAGPIYTLVFWKVVFSGTA